MIRSLVNYDKYDWNRNLIEFEVANHASVNITIAYTQFYLNYGVHPKTIPADIFVPTHQPSVHQFVDYIV